MSFVRFMFLDFLEIIVLSILKISVLKLRVPFCYYKVTLVAMINTMTMVTVTPMILGAPKSSTIAMNATFSVPIGASILFWVILYNPNILE